MRSAPPRHLLAASLAGILFHIPLAMAQHVVADGSIAGEDFKMPAAGDYVTTDPAQHAFHALNGGMIFGDDGIHLSTQGEKAAGVRVEGAGSAVFLGRSSSILTTGHGAAGIAAVAAGFDETQIAIETRGDAARGVDLDNAQLALSQATVQTSGNAAHGIVATGGSHVQLQRTDVMALGAGAWGAVLRDASQLQLDGTVVFSEKHGAVRIEGSGDTRIELSNGAFLYGGNGTAVSRDPAATGRVDVVLSGGSEIRGDIVSAPGVTSSPVGAAADLHVRLSGASTWTGRSDAVRSLWLENGSTWALSGDSRVGSLDVRSSALHLSEGARFNSLTVEGDLHTEDAHLYFRGALEGDDSAVDRLHVVGDTHGDARVYVSNVGGVGAATLEGITVIQVDGRSDASYTLAGRTVAGTNEYFLHKGGVAGGEGNWYLRSELPTTPDPCQVDPLAPGCAPIEPIEPVDPVDPVTPPSVLRPEAGVYLANQIAALGMFSHRLSDRLGSLDGGDARNAWARVGHGQANFTAVGGQLLANSNTSVLQIGTDLLRRGNAAAGVMLGSGRADSSAVSDLTGYSAKGRVRGSAVGVYGTWLQEADGTRGAYVDATLQYGRFDNRVQGIALAPEHYDSRMASASLETGYTFNVWQGAASALYVQPQLQLSHVDFRADRHVESNGTVIDHADAGGLSGRLGVRVFGHGTAAGNTVQPYLGVNWLRGSGTSTLQFNGETLGADVPRNRYEVQAGAELKLGQRWGAWGDLSVQRGDRGYRNVGGQVGSRMAW